MYTHTSAASVLQLCVELCLCASARASARVRACPRTCLARIFYCNNSSWAVLYMLMHERTRTHGRAQHVVCMLIDLCAGSYNPWNSLQMNVKPVWVAFETIQLRRQSAWFKQNLTQSCSAANLSFFVLRRKSYLYRVFAVCTAESSGALHRRALSSVWELHGPSR